MSLQKRDVGPTPALFSDVPSGEPLVDAENTVARAGSPEPGQLSLKWF